MKYLRYFACLAVPALISPGLLAQTSPDYAGSVFDELTEVALDGSAFFGLIVAIAVIVTGFFVGRKWLARVG